VEKEIWGNAMANILEEAATIVAEREQRYDLVSADLYSMARLYNNWEMQEQIWQEAWTKRSTCEQCYLLCVGDRDFPPIRGPLRGRTRMLLNGSLRIVPSEVHGIAPETPIDLIHSQSETMLCGTFLRGKKLGS
jgi:hypothetical protein